MEIRKWFRKIENGKITLRQIRGDAMRDIKLAFEKKVITEDEKFRAKEELQKIIDETNKNLEAVFEKKQKEVMG